MSNAHLKVFATAADQDAFRSGNSYVEPHVSCLSDGSGVKYNKRINANGHEYVDLGLPSGTMWATCNLGASIPEEFGEYYAWGETEDRTNGSLTWDTYEWGTENNLTKYNATDELTMYNLEDDAAHVHLGGSWIVPTEEHAQELLTNCTITSEALNETDGFRLTSNINENSIFIPKAGVYYGSTFWPDNRTLISLNGVRHVGSSIYYKSGLVLEFINNDINVSYTMRFRGIPIRPVLVPA